MLERDAFFAVLSNFTKIGLCPMLNTNIKKHPSWRVLSCTPTFSGCIARSFCRCALPTQLCRVPTYCLIDRKSAPRNEWGIHKSRYVLYSNHLRFATCYSTQDLADILRDMQGKGLIPRPVCSLGSLSFLCLISLIWKILGVTHCFRMQLCHGHALLSGF